MNRTAAPRPLPSRAARTLRRVAIALALGAAAGWGPPRAAAAEDREPKPSTIFFPEPDPETRKQVQEVIDTTFGDVTKAIEGREILVKRFGLWCAPVLLSIVERGDNQTQTWNAILAIATLRRLVGPSVNLWPAVPVLARAVEGREPIRRAFAALALGCFYGPESVRRVAPPRPGWPDAWEEERKAHAAAQAALARALADADGTVRAAAALALAKTGGAVAGDQVTAALAHGVDAAIPPRVAALLALGLLPVHDEGRVREALRDLEARVRAAAALSEACWAVGQRYGEGPETPAAATSRASSLDADLVPTKNVALRPTGVDGAEATFARGALALVSERGETFDDLFTTATTISMEAETATAAAQALLFSPERSSARTQMAKLAYQHVSVQQPLKDAVLAAFLVVAGEDGSLTGVRACTGYLKDRSREPRGKVTWDVRHYAAVGLVRALERQGGIADATLREEAVRALGEAPSKGLAASPLEPYPFRAALEQALPKGVREALLLNPLMTLPDRTSSLLVEAAEDPDALLARDPIDVVVDRLNDMTWRLVFGLDAVPKAATTESGGKRVVSHEDAHLRLLIGWFEKSPYFTRLDLHRDRGRTPAAVPANPADVNR